MDLVGNPEDRFSRHVANLKGMQYKLQHLGIVVSAMLQ